MDKQKMVTVIVSAALAAAAFAGPASAPAQKFAAAAYAGQAPAVDGDLGDAAWRGLPWNGGYVLAKKGGEPTEQTRFKALYTDDALYVAVESFERDVKSIHPEINDAEWWYVDLAELFVGTGEGETLHLIYTARGNRYEEIPGVVQLRNADKETWSAASRIGAKSWTCEFKVPFALLGVAPGDNYLTVPFNLCRCISKAREFSSWNFSPTTFRNSAGFGRLAFAGRRHPVPAAGADAMTFSCWARLPSLPDKDAPRGRTAYALLSWGGFFKMVLSGSCVLESEFDAQARGTNYQFITRSDVSRFFEAGEWAHFAATYSLKSGETALYMNGQHVGSRRDDLRHLTPLLPLPRSVKGALKVGSLAGGFFPTDGEIAHVRFLLRAVSAGELSEMERAVWTKLEPGAKALSDVLRARRDRKAAEADRLFAGGRDLRYSVVDPLGKMMYKWDTPLPEDSLDRPLKIVSTPGEYEAAAFVVRSRRAVPDFLPTATSLRTADGATLSAAVLDMRIAKVMSRAVSAYSKVRVLEPTVLLHDDKLLKVDVETMRNLMRYDFKDGPRYVDVSEPRSTLGGQKARLSAAEHPIFDAKELRPMDLPARTTIEFWVTSHVPEGTKPGVYRGEIALRTTGGESFGAVPVELRVLPFTLPEPMTRYDPSRPFERAIYHRGQAIDFSPQSPGTITQRGRNESQLRAEFRNMAAHGIQHPCICMNLPMPYWKGDPSVYNPKNGGAPCVPSEEERDYFRRYIRCMREEGMTTNPLYVFNNGNLGFRDHYNRATMHEDLKTVWRLLNEYLMENLGHTNVLYYGVDEAHGQALQNEYDLWEDAGKLGARFYTTLVTRDLPLVAGRIAVASVSHNMTKIAAKMMHDAGTRIWSYANPQSNILGQAFPYRVNFGLGEWLSNFDGYGVYAYNESNHHPWNAWDGMEWSYVFQTADGVCDLINWEGQREACDDVRYATLLLRLADERPGDATSKAAKAWLDTLDPAHPAYDPNAARAKMIDFILRLRGGTPSAGSVALVEDGVAKCRVSVEPGAHRALAFGAREIQKYLSLATGCGALDGDYPVRIRVSAAAEWLREDGFDIDVRRDGMTITGANPRGALYGCYEILKQYAGMRWLVPGDDGEYCVHKGRSVVVPVGRIVKNPYLRIRETRANTDEGFLWHARNNMLSELNTGRFVRDGKRTRECDRLEELCVRGIGISGHIQSDLLIGPYRGKEREAKRDELFARHPEWFPLIKGRRVKILGPGDANPCVSNPELLDHLASNLCERIKGPHGCESYVTVGNNDTTIWCECEKCRALDAPERAGTHGEMSDRYWHLVGGIAERVWKKMPDARLGGWAYQNYWYPPVRTKIDPRLKVFVSYNNMCWRHSVADPKCRVNGEWRRIYRMWAKLKLPFVVDREPVGGVGCIADTYQPAEHVLHENFKAFAEYGCGGAHFVLMGAQPDFFKWDNRPPWNGKNLGWYAMWQCCYMSAKCMWDLDFDFDATLEEANRLYYGAAWEGGMKEFRAYLADCYYSVDFCSGWGQGAPLGPVLDRPGSKERLLALLGRAEASAKSAGDARSLAHVRRDMEIFTKSWLYFREQYERNYKVLDVKAKTAPIKVDGVLDEADWQKAEVLTGFAAPDWCKVRSEDLRQTRVRVVRDPDALYFAVEALEDRPDSLLPGKNHVEIFYSYPDMAEKCYQLIVYREGKHVTWFRKSAGDVDKSFVSAAEVAVVRSADRWTVEVAVPTDEIGSKCLPGQVWKANVCRQRGASDGPRESSSVCNGVFYGPGNFVNLRFAE